MCKSCILIYSAQSPVFCSVIGWRFEWILGAIRGILGRFGSIRLFGSMIWVVPPLTIRISPNLPIMPRTPLRIRRNSIRMYPDYGQKKICQGHILDHFLGYSAGFEYFKTSRIPPRMFQNP